MMPTEKTIAVFYEDHKIQTFESLFHQSKFAMSCCSFN